MNPAGTPVNNPRRRIQLDLDGTTVHATEGDTLLDVCRAQGIDVPTLCYGDTIDAANACRLCMVEVEGSRVLVPSCSRPAEDNLKVRTDTERTRHARRMVLEFLATSVDLSTTPRVGEWMHEFNADPGRYGDDISTNRHDAANVDNDLYVRDYAKCILCYQCVDACGEQFQNSFAIAVAGRGSDAHIAAEFDAALPESACVYCGNCIAVCPTGALVPKTEFDMRLAGTWDESRQSRTTTVCPYCGVGCNLELHVQDNRIVKVTSPHDHSIGSGNLCVKGRFGFGHVG